MTRSQKQERKWDWVIERRLRRVETQDLWVVPYADFMSVLMVFFLMMFAFAYSSREEKKYSSIVMSIQQEMGGADNKTLRDQIAEQAQTEQTVAAIGQAVADNQLQDAVTVKTEAAYIRIQLTTPVLFATGTAELAEPARQILHSLAGVLGRMNNEIIIEGHTDNVPFRTAEGTRRSNWELSHQRALAVIEYLTAVEGVPQQRLAAAGYGEFRPLAANDTEENRRKNRRIEVVIVRSAGQPLPPAAVQPVPVPPLQAPALSTADDRIK
jgi:chemotaxis protein MotB